MDGQMDERTDGQMDDQIARQTDQPTDIVMQQGIEAHTFNPNT